MSDDLEKHLAGAMGDEAPAPKSTPKKALNTPPIVAEPEPVRRAETPRETELEMKLRLKGEILAELIAQQTAGKDVLKEVKRDLHVELPEEDMLDFTVNLPVQAANIRIDGREYHHGFTYKIRRSQLTTFREIQHRAWLHDMQVQGQRPHAAGMSTMGTPLSAAIPIGN